ncbi:ATP-dependent RNA helicase [Dirofilaria immitis]
MYPVIKASMNMTRIYAPPFEAILPCQKRSKSPHKAASESNSSCDHQVILSENSRCCGRSGFSNLVILVNGWRIQYPFRYWFAMINVFVQM